MPTDSRAAKMLLLMKQRRPLFGDRMHPYAVLSYLQVTDLARAFCLSFPSSHSLSPPSLQQRTTEGGQERFF